MGAIFLLILEKTVNFDGLFNHAIYEFFNTLFEIPVAEAELSQTHDLNFVVIFFDPFGVVFIFGEILDPVQVLFGGF